MLFKSNGNNAYFIFNVYIILIKNDKQIKYRNYDEMYAFYEK